MIVVSENLSLKLSEIKFSFIASPGPGGQNVNKVATAVLLRFNINNSSLPGPVRYRLIEKFGPKLTQQGDLLIKASRHRTQLRNKEDAIERLRQIIKAAERAPVKRKKTKPTYASQQRRLTSKKLQSRKKNLRQQHEE